MVFFQHGLHTSPLQTLQDADTARQETMIPEDTW
jgi:hypothetical protein